MVAVVVGQADGVRAHQVDACFVRRRLRALAAVQQQAVAAAGRKGGRKGPVRQRHGGRRAQQCDGQHKIVLPAESFL